jgi:hypothetical protein
VKKKNTEKLSSLVVVRKGNQKSDNPSSVAVFDTQTGAPGSY